MVDQRLRVGLSVEPFVLRSAMAACLEGDPRLDVVLLPMQCGPADDRARSAVTPPLVVLPEVMVVAVADCPARVELSVAGTSRTVLYDGMGGLADALVNELALLSA